MFNITKLCSFIHPRTWNISQLKFYREKFEEYRGKVETYFDEGKTPRTWEFHPTHAFSRMNSFVRRLEDIKDIFEVAREFLKIEKIEFGGPKGKFLGYKLKEILLYRAGNTTIKIYEVL